MGASCLTSSDLLDDEDQGSDGPWKAGLLISKGKPATRLAERFPATVAKSLGAGHLVGPLVGAAPRHRATRAPRPQRRGAAGSTWVLRARGELGAAGGRKDTVVPYRDRHAVLFDNTDLHEAWNRGATDRVTLFLEVLRPASGRSELFNHATQRLLALDRRYRCAPARPTNGTLR